MSLLSRCIGKICIVFAVAFMLIISVNWAYIFDLCYGNNIIVSMPWIVSPLMICSLFLGLLGVVTEYMNDIRFAYQYHDKNAYIKNTANRIFQAGANVWWLVSGAVILGLSFIWAYYEYISMEHEYYINVVDNSIWVLLVLGMIVIETLFYHTSRYHSRHIELVSDKENDRNKIALNNKLFDLDENMGICGKSKDMPVSADNNNKTGNGIWGMIPIICLFAAVGLSAYYCISHSVSPTCFVWHVDVTLLMPEIIIATILLGANALLAIFWQLSQIKQIRG